MNPSATYPMPISTSTGPRFLGLAFILVGIAFAVVEQRPLFSKLDDFAVDQEQMEAESAGGNLMRRAGFSLVALLGVIGLLRAPREAAQHLNPLGALAIAYFAWCLASITWSSAPADTARRLILLSFCFLGTLGTSRHLNLRDLCILALTLNAVYILGGVAAEIALGTFRPWAGDYRFAGMAHPNSQGSYCATLCLAAVALLRKRSAAASWLAGALAIGLVLLVLTRSRTAVAGFLAALIALMALRASARAKVGAVVGMGLAASIMLWFAFAVFTQVEKRIADAALLGRQEDAESFNGRVPLWTELMTRYVAQRPWCGYGYGTFWSAQHIEDASALFHWGIREAHSAYVESLLGTGVIGTGLLLLVVLAALLRAASAFRHTREGGSAFLASMLVFALVQGSMESGFVQPFFLGFLVACGVLRLAHSPLDEEIQP